MLAGMRRSLGPRLTGIALVAGVLLAGMAGIAEAAPSSASASAPAAGAAPTLPAADKPLEAAGVLAKRTGHPVAVSSLTTQTSTTVADPDGKFEVTSSVLPVRVEQDGQWVPVSATLRRAADGGYEPTATPSAVTLSPGGTGALAVLTSVPVAGAGDRRGHRHLPGRAARR
jgi:hypothetical protein